MQHGTSAMQSDKRHPTDANGEYLYTGDDQYRLDRNGTMYIADSTIAWFGVGDVIYLPDSKDPGIKIRGQAGRIRKVDPAGQFYIVGTGIMTRAVTFKDALEANKHLITSKQRYYQEARPSQVPLLIFYAMAACILWQIIFR